MEIVATDEAFTILDKHGNFFAKTYSSTDARLIAAAPELLEAALIAHQSAIEQKNRGYLITYEALACLTAAIQKTGSAP